MNAAGAWFELVRDTDVIVVQTKRGRLGTTSLAKRSSSPSLVRDWLPVRRVKSVAVCSAADDELRGLVESLGVEVVVLEGHAAPKEPKSSVRALRERYWQTIGGTLIERYSITPANGSLVVHHAEALILPDRETCLARTWNGA